MNRLLAAASALTVLAIASTASAADLGARSAPVYTKAPEYSPATNWSGFYIGGNVGWTGGSDALDSSGAGSGNADAVNIAALVQSTNQHIGSSSGVIGGGQIGYNWQMGTFLAGLEADIQGVGSSHRTSSGFGSVVGSEPSGIATSITSSSGPSYLGTFRARLGTTVTPSLLLYATAGLAYGGVKSTTTLNPSFAGGAQEDSAGESGLGPSTGSFSGTRVGYAAGAGVEWMFAPNWSTKLEYLHYDLGSATYSTGGIAFDAGVVQNVPGNGTASASTSSTVHFRNEIVRVGVNYHFN